MSFAPIAESVSEPQGYAFTHVNVIPMDVERVLQDQTVVVKGGRIVALTATRNGTLPRSATVIDGSGRYLLPGLADMHVHVGVAYQGMQNSSPTPDQMQELRDELLLFVANGVVTVRNMSGSPLHLWLVPRLENGDLLGPHLVTASPIIDGSPPAWPSAVSVTDPARARELVRSFAAEGYSAIKVYHNLSPDVYHAIADEAHKLKIPVVGHVPFRVGLEGVLDAGQYSIEHLRGYDMVPGAPQPTTMVERFSGFLSVSDSLIKEFARATRVSGAWNCPTLALQVDGAVSSEGRQRLLARPEMQLLPKPLREWMTNDRFYTSAPPAVLEAIRSSVPVEFKVLRELATQGAPLIAGTDTPLLMSMPGFALHRELEVMTEAGLSPYEALRAATVNAARFLHREKSSGTIAPGMQADLILLDGDPLQDITRTRAIAGVMLRGQWLDRARLDSALQDLRRRNEKNL